MKKIAIIGIGYVGLPLALLFSKKYKVVAFDKNKEKIISFNNEIFGDLLDLNDFPKRKFEQKNIKFTSNLSDIAKCNYYIITVPTPIKKNKLPELKFLKQASFDVSKYLKNNDIIIYESTVYPGCTEEICVPILEKNNYLKFNIDYFIGYSPERINPGDPNYQIYNTKKLVSASNKKTLNKIYNLYSSVIDADVIKVKSIKEAESAKVIENIQRDLNIAFFNELAVIFKKMDINFTNVIKAASTKWNFHSYEPGLVGGHCIGVDPYYLTYKAKKEKVDPKIILAGREINENMVSIVAKDFLKNFNTYIDKYKLTILIMGVSFKSNCGDTRNSKIKELIKKILNKKINVVVYDPHINRKDVLAWKLNIKIIDKIDFSMNSVFDSIFIAVDHNLFYKIKSQSLIKLLKPKGFIYDFKKIYKNRNNKIIQF